MRPPYEEMRILSYGLSDQNKERLKEQVPILFSPSYAHFDFSGHDGWDRLKDFRALSIICEPVPETRLTPYAPPYIVLRGVEELRRISCPPADALVLLLREADRRFTAFPHLDIDLDDPKDKNGTLRKAARLYEQAQIPCLRQLDGRLPERNQEGPRFTDGYIVVSVDGDTQPGISRIHAQKTKDFQPVANPIEFVWTAASEDSAQTRQPDTMQAFAQWNAQGLPLVSWDTAQLSSVLQSMDALPPHWLTIDLMALWARLFPECCCMQSTESGSMPASAQEALSNGISTAQAFFAPLRQRYHQPFDHVLQLLDLYRPEALDALRQEQTPDTEEQPEQEG